MGGRPGARHVLKSTSITSEARVGSWLAGDSALEPTGWASTGDTTRETRPEQHHGHRIGVGRLGVGDLCIADLNPISGPTAENQTLSSSTPSEEYGETEVVTDLDPIALATLSPHLRQVLENMQETRRGPVGSSSIPLHRSDSEEELTERASEAAKQKRRTIGQQPIQSTDRLLPTPPSNNPRETSSTRHYAAMLARYDGLRNAVSRSELQRSDITPRDCENSEPKKSTATALDQTSETTDHKVQKISVGRRLRNAVSYRRLPRSSILPREAKEVVPEDSTDTKSKENLKGIVQKVKDKVKTVFGRKKKTEQEEESEERLNRQGKTKRNLRKSASTISIHERSISNPVPIPPVSTIPTTPIPTEEQRTNSGFTENTQINNATSPGLGESSNGTTTNTIPRKPLPAPASAPAPAPAPIMSNRGHIEDY